MLAETILYIIITGVVSLIISAYMYGYKSKSPRKLRYGLGLLRFCTLFVLGILLINPKFTNTSFQTIKPKLAIAIDNSLSIRVLNKDSVTISFINKLQNNPDIKERFTISLFSFGNNFSDNDSLSFSEKNTNIAKALTGLETLFKSEIAPTVLITDGNQTLGTDYEFKARTFSNSIYPVVLGDTISYIDLKLERLNTNRYAYLKNKFPIETTLVYSGKEPVSTQFIISQGASIVHRETLNFSEEDNIKTIQLTLSAQKSGLQRYTAKIIPLDSEKNKINNSKQFAVEVIDQATNVLIVSAIAHPDLGALRKAIVSNQQRKAKIVNPSEAITLLNDYQLIVLYQPNYSFSNLYSEINKLKKNTWTFTGIQTDWGFLNGIQDKYNKDIFGGREEVTAIFNRNYGIFSVDDINFSEFPPLDIQYGDLTTFLPNEMLLEQSVNGFTTLNPILMTIEEDSRREALWDGEGIWKWRANSYLQERNFIAFDNFIGSMVQYLASNKKRTRLNVNYESFYYNNGVVAISAQYFDNNFVFDSQASLLISVKNKETLKTTNFPLLLKNNYYEVDLNSFEAGDYTFTVSVKDEAISRSGTFTILDYSTEQQFLNANVSKLQRVAETTNGQTFFVTEVEELIQMLLNENRFKPIQKSEQKIVPLIDWKYLLILLVILLSVEWFIRKYNGLI